MEPLCTVWYVLLSFKFLKANYISFLSQQSKKQTRFNRELFFQSYFIVFFITEQQAMKEYGGSAGITPSIL